VHFIFLLFFFLPNYDRAAYRRRGKWFKLECYSLIIFFSFLMCYWTGFYQLYIASNVMKYWTRLRFNDEIIYCYTYEYTISVYETSTSANVITSNFFFFLQVKHCGFQWQLTFAVHPIYEWLSLVIIFYIKNENVDGKMSNFLFFFFLFFHYYVKIIIQVNYMMTGVTHRMLCVVLYQTMFAP
jgi:hypothetical protein